MLGAPAAQVVDDLGHRPALVVAAGFRRRRERPDRLRGAAGTAGTRQVAAGDVLGGVGRGAVGLAVEGVGEDADGDAAAVDPAAGAGAGGVKLACPPPT